MSALFDQENIDDFNNPLDSVEDILCANDWVYDRTTEDELSVTVSCKFGTYRLFFLWDSEFYALQLCCQYDFSFGDTPDSETFKTLSSINANLWLGHFDIRDKTNKPCFRHTCLFRGVGAASGTEHIEDLVEIALLECERHYSVFDLLARSHKSQQEQQDGQLALAMMSSAGEA